MESSIARDNIRFCSLSAAGDVSRNDLVEVVNQLVYDYLQSIRHARPVSVLRQVFREAT